MPRETKTCPLDSIREVDDEDDHSQCTSPVSSSSFPIQGESGQGRVRGRRSKDDARRHGESSFRSHRADTRGSGESPDERSLSLRRRAHRPTEEEPAEREHDDADVDTPDLYDRFSVESIYGRETTVPVNTGRRELEKEKNGCDGGGGGVGVAPLLASLSKGGGRSRRRQHEEDGDEGLRKTGAGEGEEEDEDRNTLLSVFKKASLSRRRGLFRDHNDGEKRKEEEKESNHATVHEERSESPRGRSKGADEDAASASHSSTRVNIPSAEEPRHSSRLVEGEEETSSSSRRAIFSLSGQSPTNSDSSSRDGGLLASLLRKVSSSFFSERKINSSRLSSAPGLWRRATAPSRMIEGEAPSSESRQKHLAKEEEEGPHAASPSTWLTRALRSPPPSPLRLGGEIGGLLSSRSDRTDRERRRRRSEGEYRENEQDVLTDRHQRRHGPFEEEIQTEKEETEKQQKRYGGAGSEDGFEEDSRKQPGVSRDHTDAEMSFYYQGKGSVSSSACSSSSCSPSSSKKSRDGSAAESEELSSSDHRQASSGLQGVLDRDKTVGDASVSRERTDSEGFFFKRKNIPRHEADDSSRNHMVRRLAAGPPPHQENASPQGERSSLLALSSSPSSSSCLSASSVFTPLSLSSYSPATSRLTASSSSSSSSVLSNDSLAGEEGRGGRRRKEPAVTIPGDDGESQQEPPRHETGVGSGAAREHQREVGPGTPSSSSLTTQAPSTGSCSMACSRSSRLSTQVNVLESSSPLSSLLSSHPASSEAVMGGGGGGGRESCGSRLSRPLPAERGEAKGRVPKSSDKEEKDTGTKNPPLPSDGLTLKEKAKQRRYIRRIQRKRVMMEKRQILLLLSSSSCETVESAPPSPAPVPPLPEYVNVPFLSKPTGVPAHAPFLRPGHEDSALRLPEETKRKRRMGRRSLIPQVASSSRVFLPGGEDTHDSDTPHVNAGSSSGRSPGAPSLRHDGGEPHQQSREDFSSSSSPCCRSNGGFLTLFELQSEGFFSSSFSSGSSSPSTTSSQSSDSDDWDGMRFTSYHKKHFTSSSSDSSLMSTSTEDEEDEELKLRRLQRKSQGFLRSQPDEGKQKENKTTPPAVAFPGLPSSSSRSAPSLSSSFPSPPPPSLLSSSAAARPAPTPLGSSLSSSSFAASSSSCLNPSSGREDRMQGEGLGLGGVQQGTRAKGGEEEERESSASKSTGKRDVNRLTLEGGGKEQKDEREEKVGGGPAEGNNSIGSSSSNDGSRCLERGGRSDSREKPCEKGSGKSFVGKDDDVRSGEEKGREEVTSVLLRGDDSMAPLGADTVEGRRTRRAEGHRERFFERRFRSSRHDRDRDHDGKKEEKNSSEGEKKKMDETAEVDATRESLVIPSEPDDVKSSVSKSSSGSRRGSVTSEGALSLHERLRELSGKYNVQGRDGGGRGSRSVGDSTLVSSDSLRSPNGTLPASPSLPPALLPGKNSPSSLSSRGDQEKGKKREDDEGERKDRRRDSRAKGGGDTSEGSGEGRRHRREGSSTKEEDGAEGGDQEMGTNNNSLRDERVGASPLTGVRGEEGGTLRERMTFTTTSATSLWRGYASYFQEMREKVLEHLKQNQEDEGGQPSNHSRDHAEEEKSKTGEDEHGGEAVTKSSENRKTERARQTRKESEAKTITRSSSSPRGVNDRSRRRVEEREEQPLKKAGETKESDRAKKDQDRQTKKAGDSEKGPPEESGQVPGFLCYSHEGLQGGGGRTRTRRGWRTVPTRNSL